MIKSDHPVSDAGGRDKRMTKGEQTRRKIVAAAAPIFNQHGYEGSSLADLMAATGLQKGGIYRHFSSKEELAAEAFDYAWKAASKTRLFGVDENASGLDQLKQLISSFVHARSPVAGGCPILNTAVEADDGNPVLRARASKALRSWLARLQTAIERAATDQEVRPGVDSKELATVIVASLEGALMISRLERNDYALRRVEQHLLNYVNTVIAAPIR